MANESITEVSVPVRIRGSRPTGLTGAAGEYFVAAELSLRGWLATVTIKNAPYTDVLAQKPLEGLAVAIQTKTSSGGNRFQLNSKAEGPSKAQNQWYVFVRLDEDEVGRPRYFVVPHNVMAGALFAQHREWLSGKKRDGSDRRDSAMRSMPLDDIAAYEDRWDLLEAPTDQAPLLID